MRYNSWDTEQDKQNVLSFWAIFCPFNPLTTPKIKILKKWRKHLEMSSFYTCVPKTTIMRYSSWNTERGKQIFLSFWAIFCPFNPLTTPKTKILKKWKKAWWYYDFTHLYHKWKSYDVWFLMECERHNFFSFWTIFCPFTPLTTQKIKILKKWKNRLHQKSWSYATLFLRYNAWRM